MTEVAHTELWAKPPERWVAPWDGTQCAVLNKMQGERQFHPYTCPGEMATCSRQRELIATADGWICKCGHYRQAWAHAVPKLIADAVIARHFGEAAP